MLISGHRIAFMTLILMACSEVATTPSDLRSVRPMSHDAAATSDERRVVLGSGMVVMDGRDLANTVIAGPEPTPYSAYVVAKHEAYADPLPGTTYIGVVPNSTDWVSPPGRAILQSVFTLPNNSTNHSLILRAHADDAAFFWLNGQPVGGHDPNDFSGCNYGGAPCALPTWELREATAFQVGNNVLTIELSNYHDFPNPSALNYLAEITFTCETGTVVEGTECIGPKYAFQGFFRPIENLPTINVVRSGRAVPVKFSVGGYQGLEIMNSGYPISRAIDCDLGVPQESIDETTTAGESSLSYDSASDQYVYLWKTDETWSGCRQLVVRLRDGSEHTANFRFSE